jgi:hypothetical protein
VRRTRQKDRALPANTLVIGDQITIERIEALIGDLQAQKATLHPEQKP